MNNLAYRTWGIRGRPALVLLHGFLGDSEDWRPLVSLLEDDFYLVAIDLPGHGNSQSVELAGDDAFRLFSQILNLTLQQLDLKRFSLLGYSLGGRLAMMYSLDHGGSVEHLLLESCHPGLESDADRSIRSQSDSEWASLFRTEPLEEVLQRWYHQPVFADLNSQQRQSLMEHRLRVNKNSPLLGNVLDGCSLSRQPACWGKLEDVSFPVHYFYGEKDLKFTEIALRLHKSGSLAGLHKVSAAGHNVHREQPEAMADVIRQLSRESARDRCER